VRIPRSDSTGSDRFDSYEFRVSRSEFYGKGLGFISYLVLLISIPGLDVGKYRFELHVLQGLQLANGILPMEYPYWPWNYVG
jgi:hypothetical protein